MGAYITKEWPTSVIWKLAARKRQKLILGPQYLQAMHDEYTQTIHALEKNHPFR